MQLEYPQAKEKGEDKFFGPSCCVNNQGLTFFLCPLSLSPPTHPPIHPSCTSSDSYS